MKMPNPIKVFIVDDHLVVREGITSILYLEKGIEVVGQASNAQETLSQISKLVPDIILMDLKMPGIDGLQLTRLVRNQLPACKVIILTLYDQFVAEARKVGAKGYLLKDINLEDLVDSIKRVYRGEEVYDKRVRPTIEIDYEEKSEEEEKDLPGTDAEGTSLDVSNTLFEQVRVFILPPADISESLKLTSIAEEALTGDFKQVEGTLRDGISITFKINKPVSTGEINRRLLKIPDVTIFNYDALAGSNDFQNLIKKQQAFDIKHPSIKTVFVRLRPQG
jgi:DNA-binding NarL/FixJ family response regulator